MGEIKVTGATPLEALAALTAFGLHCQSNEKVSAAANRTLAEEIETAPESAPSPEPEAPAPVDKPKPETPPAPVPKTGETSPAAAPADQPKTGPFPTAEAVRDKGIEASRTYGKDAVVAILKDFGVSGMSALAEQDRAAFLARLEGLGGGNA